MRLRKKIGKPTWSKSYGPKPVKQLGVCNVAIHGGTDVRGTNLDGLDSKHMNTAPAKLRYDILKKHGVKALHKTYKR